MTDKEIKEKLVEVYGSQKIQDILSRYRTEIDVELKEVIKKIPRECKTLSSLDSRIKTKDSFEEKLTRKDYVHKWGKEDIEYNDDEAIKKCILNELPDPIGFRLYCYFKKDVEMVFNVFKDELEINSVIDFVEEPKVKIQKNGLVLYKFGLKFKDQINFELQIKSLMDGLWDEVDHDTVYKSSKYDIYREQHQNIIIENNKTLAAMDNQLSNLYDMKNAENELINALFYIYASKNLEKSEGKILSFPFESILKFLSEYSKEGYDAVKKYVSGEIVRSENLKKIKKKKVKLDSDVNKERITSKMGDNNYTIGMGYKILSLLFEFDNEEIYQDYIIDSIYKKIKPDNTDAEDEFFCDEAEDYEHEENETGENDISTDICKIIDEIFGIKGN